MAGSSPANALKFRCGGFDDILALLDSKRIQETRPASSEQPISESRSSRGRQELRYTTLHSIVPAGNSHTKAKTEIRGSSMNWSEQVVLVTGGTGSFGKKFVEIMLREYHPKRLVILSRDELKQHDMRASGFDHSSLRYFLGDVRDAGRLERAFDGVTVVVHAAALKQVPACEYNPFEAIQTNIMGGRNVIDAAIDQGVRRVLALSTDKAVNPINLYGATKLCAEKVFVQANAYAGAQDSRFSCARYGNVVGSRGSVIPVFMEQRRRGRITITDPRMTRFWLTLEQGVKFVVRCLEQMHGGEIFVPKIPSMRLVDLAETVAPGCRAEYIGI